MKEAYLLHTSLPLAATSWNGTSPGQRPVTSRIHTLEIPTPFPVGPVNVYLIEGREPALIDTGPNTSEA